MYGVNTKVHAAGPAPAPALEVDQIGTNMPAQDTPAYATSYFRSFRPSEPATAPQFAGTEANLPAQLSDHMTLGKPDERRGVNTRVATDRSLEAQPEAHALTWNTQSFAPQQAPVRARAGFTGEDPARAARTVRNLYQRAFDQTIGQIMGVKQMMAAPLAQLPLDQADAAPGALPSASPAGANRKAGWGLMPNTYRLLPRPWDEQLVTGGTSTAAYDAMAAQARGGFRAR